MRYLLAISMVLWSMCSGQAQDFRTKEFLPLSVGNSWTYIHSYHVNTNFISDPDIPTAESDDIDNLGGAIFYEKEVTITINQTEVIDGETYYVFSEMPYSWPPPPYFFLAGKSVRWGADGALILRDKGSEVSLFRFNSNQDGIRISYPISGHDGDTLAVGSLERYVGALRYGFVFLGLRPYKFESRGATWIYSFGMETCDLTIPAEDFLIKYNILSARVAHIGDRTVLPSDILFPTNVESGSWGSIKNATTFTPESDP